MKFSFTRAPRRPLDRQTAWGCLTANLFGLPGLGSLAAGRYSGYGQMALSLTGLALTTAFAIPFFTWFSSHKEQLNNLQDDPGAYFHEIWLHLRWPLLGLGVFLTGWLWALGSSLAILSQAKPNEPKPLPPRIQP